MTSIRGDVEAARRPGELGIEEGQSPTSVPLPRARNKV